MRLDVVFTPAGLRSIEVQGRTVFVIDILRATTAMCAAIAHGARAIIPAASTEEALRLAQTIGSDDVLLAGEKNCVRIPGFHLGNSPLEMRGAGGPRQDPRRHHHQRHQGAAGVPGSRRGLSRRGLESLPGRGSRRGGDRARRRPAHRLRRAGRRVFPRRRVLRRTAHRGGIRQRRPHRALNDAGLASLDLVRRYGDRWERPLARSRGGRELIRLGFRDDVLDAARLDAYPVLPHFHERRVTLQAVPV